MKLVLHFLNFFWVKKWVKRSLTAIRVSTEDQFQGSAHSCCNHPSLKPLEDKPLKLMATFASVGRVPPIAIASKELNIKGDPWGIKNGWFNFPFNFDPVWLLNCDGYERKERKT